MRSRDIIEAALALPKDDRIQLMAALEAATLEEDDVVPEEIVAIVHERMARVRAGEPSLPGEEVFAEILRR